jgi:DNA-binding beta-propeller fold protein YncE
MRVKTSIISLFISIFLITSISCSQKRDERENSDLKYFGKITAPDFPKGAEWLNTDKPISLKDLRGKLALLDFWTYCCINCMHIIPDLKKLESKYREDLVVIGVHSAKFLTEQGTENIRQAILRYDVEHPVINDKDLVVWNEYGVRAWPTLVLIDPNGKILVTQSGEGVYDYFDPIISSAIAEYNSVGGILNHSVPRFALEKDKAPKSLLSFPGKVAVDSINSRLLITDSDNNRILILKMDGTGENAEVEDVIGSGKEGKTDGSYSDAEFFRPQGIAYHNDVLYVADTENHLIREIDLKTKQVKTIAGLGYQSHEWGPVNGKVLETALNSPWDLVYDNDALYIAMAGSHQIWKLDLKTNEIGTYAGSGQENIRDGAFDEADLAQPSGITTDGMKLYFADSEVSGVRSADLNPNGRVNTIIGVGLFDFGDIDGIGSNARLQHPLGIVYNPSDKLLYVADTYNSKIKTVNPVTRECVTYSGTGKEGNRNGIGDAQFNEPSGLAIMNGKIYVTDTDNNLLRVIDMNTREVKTVRFTNPDKLTPKMQSVQVRKFENPIKLEAMEVNPGVVKIKFNFQLPEGFEINPDAKPQVALSSPENLTENIETEINTELPEFELPINIKEGMGKLDLEVLIYYCETKNIGLCKFKDLVFEIPLNVSLTGNGTLKVNYTLN